MKPLINNLTKVVIYLFIIAVIECLIIKEIVFLIINTIIVVNKIEEKKYYVDKLPRNIRLNYLNYGDELDSARVKLEYMYTI